MDFEILILGSDANAYYMARCAYEAYHKKAHLLAKSPLAFTKYSNILTIEYHEELWNEEGFVRLVNAYLDEQKEKKVLIVSTNETYSMFLAKYKKEIRKNGIFFEQNVSVLESLANKEKFYKTYKNCELSFPDTYYFDVKKNTVLPSLEYPMILKPANVVSYNHISFEGKRKIYQIKSEEELKRTIELIKGSGYQDKLILQEFIPGDDSYLFDSVVYIDRHKKVKIITFAQIGLQERSKNMIGNAATLINGMNTFDGNVENMKDIIMDFAERHIGMNGFYEFDLKYDARKDIFRVLEINARQGRCSYYLTPLGANLIKVMVEDLIEEKEIPFRDFKKKCLLSFVPKKIVEKYVLNEEFKKEALSMWKERVSPMECKLDKNIKRFFMMKKRLAHYKKEYEMSDWEE